MHELLIVEARSAGLRPGDVSLNDVDRRRVELWALAAAVLAAAVALSWLAPARMAGMGGETSAWTFRVVLGLLAVVFIASLVEKELHLRRLQTLLLEERLEARAFAERAATLVGLADAGRAVNSSLDVDAVLRSLLDRALDMTGVHDGAVLLVDHRPTVAALRVACARGQVRVAGQFVHPETGREGGALTAALREREALLRIGPDGRPAIAVPLVHRDELLGALEVRGEPGALADDDVQLLSVFADYVSVGLVNARLYDDARAQVMELTHLDELKSQFLATVSHELKTPLTSIIGSTSVLRRARLDDAQRREFLESIDRQARRLAAIVDQLLVAGKLAEEGPDPDAVSDLAGMARSVAADFALAGNPVEIDVPDTCLVRCAPDPLSQVLTNLCDNAFKHGAPPVRLEVALRGSVVVCSVLDRGPGVPAAARESVFERFHRLDATGSRPGMGLGLPIVRQIAHASGGRVWIDERPGGGAAVRVALEAAARTTGGVPTDTLTAEPAPRPSA